MIAGGGVIFALGVVLALVMREHGFVPAPRDEAESTVRAMVATGRAGARLVRRTPVLLLILAISAFYGAWSEAYDRLGEAHVIRDVGLPSFAGLSFIVWFGVISAASLLLSLLVARPANRRLEHAPRQTITRVLLFADVALIATVAIFGLAGAFWLALVAMLATNTHPRARRPALLELAQPVDHRLERARDGLLDHEPGGRDRAVDGRPGDRRGREHLRDPRGARARRVAPLAGGRALRARGSSRRRARPAGRGRRVGRRASAAARGAPGRSLRSTEYAGRGAGRPSSAVVIRRTRQSTPASSKIASANSAHVHSPAAARCQRPGGSSISSRTATARSPT